MQRPKAWTPYTKLVRLHAQPAAVGSLRLWIHFISFHDNLGILFQNRENSFLKVQLRMVRGVYVDPHPNERRFKSLLRSRVKHLRPNRGCIRVPTDEDNLWSCAAVDRLKFNINQAITAVIFWKFLNKVIESLCPFPLFLNHNCLLILNFVDKITKVVWLLQQLELVKSRDNFVGNFYTGRLRGLNKGMRRIRWEQSCVLHKIGTKYLTKSTLAEYQQAYQAGL